MEDPANNFDLSLEQRTPRSCSTKPSLVPIGAFSEEYGLTLSLPGVIGRRGLREFYPPSVSNAEKELLARSVAALKKESDRSAKG
jgi:malate/lactate dehydrogenase